MDSTLMSIQLFETKIESAWIIENGKLVADVNGRRINNLIKSELDEVARSSDGWSVLYLDKKDGRYWELSYPDSGLHGGGAPCLVFISPDKVSEKYKISHT
ncbi:hypothetical protein GTP45_12710 [Pseudoduganella sp. FT55W]|uniref:Uncharacterized protein n=1 Tax=Duganella rivi TaxID=2666083 RepID=A0A7X4KC08_9BURK|nr:Imm27 family immunity protein [Duganella rivi]MYM67690.1 hypothetical protein [Duganella rivi]